MSQNKLTLAEWIDKKGVLTVSLLLKVNPATVRYWRSGHVLPRTHQMKEIKRVTRGIVGYDQIIDCQPKKVRTRE